MSTVAATAARHKLRALGYDPLPCRGKAPTSVKGWQDKFDTSRDEIDLWGKLYEYDENTGVLTKFTPALDVDITFQPAAEAVREFLEEHFSERGYVMIRTGRAPKFAVLFRTDEPFTKLKRQFTAQNETTHALEFLGDGQQVIVDGIHPDTGRPYAWFKGSPLNIAHGDIPYIRRDDAVALLDALGAMLVNVFGFKLVEPEAKPNGAGGPTGEHGAAVWGSLVANILAGAGLHDSLLQGANSLLGQGSNRAGAIRTLQGILANATCPHDARWQDRYNDIPRLVRDAAEKQGKGKEPEAEVKDVQNEEPTAKVGPPLLFPATVFTEELVVPEYIIDGALQRGFIYSLTASPGAGKTAISLLMALCVARGLPFGNKMTERAGVLYFAGENPDDVRMRWIALCQNMGVAEADVDNVWFVKGAYSFSEIADRLRTETAGLGLGIVFVDTSAVFFEGEEENSNTAMQTHAMRLREVLASLDGNPTVIVLCHPAKNAAPDNLVPRGGSAFLGSMDGNLTCRKTDSALEFHHDPHKFRGPEFEAMNFQLKTVTHERLKDKKGRLMPTVVCLSVSEQAVDDIKVAQEAFEDAVLVSIGRDGPSISMRERATRLGWMTGSGEPNKQKVSRCVKALVKDGLLKIGRGGRPELTKQGTEQVKKAKDWVDENDDENGTL